MRFPKKSVLTLIMTALMLAGYGSLAGQQPKLRDTLVGHTGFVGGGIFSPDGKWLVTKGGGSDLRPDSGTWPAARASRSARNFRP